jgi:hypothetical protein
MYFWDGRRNPEGVLAVSGRGMSSGVKGEEVRVQSARQGEGQLAHRRCACKTSEGCGGLCISAGSRRTSKALFLMVHEHVCPGARGGHT